MTVVREIEHNIIDGVIQLDRFKIVYVAPMKVRAVRARAVRPGLA
jgi:hypothetical protein